MTDRVALVTGASRGIGRACCLALAADGYKVAAIARNKPGLDETVRIVEASGGAARYWICDIEKYDQVRKMVTEVAANYGPLQVVVNNAGRGSNAVPSKSYDLDVADWESSLALNVTGAFLVSRESIRYLKSNGGGSIVNIGSIAGRRASYLSDVAYTVAKTALVGLTRHQATEVAQAMIRVNTVCPGIITSERVRKKWEQLDPTKKEHIRRGIPLGRLGETHEVASAVCFLASDRASYITGAILDVNGGMYMP